MPLLIDQNLSRRLRQPLSAMFGAVAHVSDFDMSEAGDESIWLFARVGGWVILSKDADFADRALVDGPPPKVIRLRIGNGPWHSAADVVLAHEERVRAFLADAGSPLLVLTNG